VIEPIVGSRDLTVSMRALKEPHSEVELMYLIGGPNGASFSGDRTERTENQ
jgi:hypothetical protein